jgi:hypothetical protein
MNIGAIISFCIENKAVFVGIGAIIMRYFEKKKVVKKYENIISGMNGQEKH